MKGKGSLYGALLETSWVYHSRFLETFFVKFSVAAYDEFALNSPSKNSMISNFPSFRKFRVNNQPPYHHPSPPASANHPPHKPHSSPIPPLPTNTHTGSLIPPPPGSAFPSFRKFRVNNQPPHHHPSPPAPANHPPA